MLALAATLAQPALGVLLRVPQDYPTISLAANVAQPRDSIQVAYGAYEDESATIRGGVTLFGVPRPDGLPPEILGGTLTLLDGPDTTRVEGFSMFNAPYQEGLIAYGPKVAIANCLIVPAGPWTWAAIRLYSGGSVSFCDFEPNGEATGVVAREGRVQISYCFLNGMNIEMLNEGAQLPVDVHFRNNTLTGAGIDFRLGPGSTLDVTNNIFLFGATIWTCRGGSPGGVRYNCFWQGWSDCGYGEGNIFEDPMLCWYPHWPRIYDLHAESPCVGSGEGGTNMGAFPVGCGITAIDGVPPTRHVAFTVDPNPVRSVAAFTFDAIESPTLEIYDPNGRLIDLLRPTGQSATWLPGSEVQSGMYFARLRGVGGTQVVKFLVVR